MSILSFISGLVSLVRSVFSWFTGAQQRKIGAQQQALKDDAATIKQADEARQIESKDAALPDAAVDAELRQFSREK